MTAGYGADTWCLDEMRPGVMVRGPLLVAQALYRRLITPRGTLRGGDEAQAYGLDLSEYVGAIGVATAVDAVPGLVRAELLKDDRVQDVDVRATTIRATDGTLSLSLEIAVVLADSGESFALTLRVDEAAGVLLEEITA